MILPIVLDTCTILNLLRIDEDDEFLYKELIKLNINICKTVFDEIYKNIRIKTFSDNQRKYISAHVSHFGSNITKCESQFEEDYKKNIQKFCNYKKENGEFYSTLISLYICRKEKCRLYFYTDDYPAKSTFENFFNYQQIGTIGDTVDLLLFLYWINSDFNQKRLEFYLRNLLSEFAIPLKKFQETIMKNKESWIKTNPRDGKLVKNLSNIEDGINKLDLKMIDTGIEYLKHNANKYKWVATLFDEYSDIKLEGYMVTRIKTTITRLNDCFIYKVC